MVHAADLADFERVSNKTCRRGIHKDVVVMLLQFFHNHLQRRTAHDFARVWRNRTAISKSRLPLTSEGSISCLISSHVGLSLTRRRVIPLWWLSIWNSSARRGLRISRPISTTFLPRRAKLTARLAAVNVFPSPEVEEVNITTLSPGSRMNSQIGTHLTEYLLHLVVPVLLNHDVGTRLHCVVGNRHIGKYRQ